MSRRLGFSPASPGQLVGRLKSAPVTLGYVALIWTVNLTSRIPHLFPGLPAKATLGLMAASPSALFVRPWSVLTSALWVPGPVYSAFSTGALLLIGIPLERRLRPRLFAAAAAVGQVLGVLIAAGLVWAMRPIMGSWPVVLTSEWYLGPTAALCGVVMAATSAMTVLWRRRLRTIVPTLLLVLVLYQGSFPDLVRLCAAAVGMLLGPFVLGLRPVVSWPAVSRREARVLVALVVAACAVGPIIAGLSQHALGPLSVLRFLFTDIQPVDPQALQKACASSASSGQCQLMLLQLRAGAGEIFMAILPCFLLLLCAEGLRRGRRFAWRSTLIVLGGMAALALTHIAGVLWPKVLGTVQNQRMGFQDLSHLHYTLGLVLPLLLPVALFLGVAGFRSLFTLKAPHGTYTKLGRKILMLGIGLAAVYVAGGLALSSGFTPTPSLPQFLADVPDRFLPLGYTLDVSPAIFPESTPAVLLYEGIGIIFWTLSGVLVLRSFLQHPSSEDGTDLERARTVLRSGTGSPLSWMTTWPQNRHWFAPDGSGYVAYRLISGVALALGPPVGQTTRYRDYVEGFSRFCSDNAWTACFYSAGQDLREITEPMGWGSVEVAQQTIIPLPTLTFGGKKFQPIRAALNRASKEDIHAEWINYLTAPTRIRQQIDALSEEWIADRKLPELGFTLGGIPELQDPEVRCLLALDANQALQGFTSWLPIYRNGRIEGWTVDLMRRRRNGGFAKTMEFLIATAALTFRDEGYSYLSLSGVPLVRPEEKADETTTLGRVLEWGGGLLEPVYGFRSLLAFKSKFGPLYEPLFLVYPDAAALPNIAKAIARAYLGDISLLQRLALARHLVRRAPRDAPKTSPVTVGPRTNPEAS